MRQAVKASIAFQIPYTTSFLGTYGHLDGSWRFFFFNPSFVVFWKKCFFFVLELFLNHWSWGNLYIYLSICWGTLLLFGFALWNFLLWACSKKRLFASLSLLHNSSKFQDFRNSSPMILIFMANQPTPNVSFPEIRPAITFFIWFLPLWNRFF